MKRIAIILAASAALTAAVPATAAEYIYSFAAADGTLGAIDVSVPGTSGVATTASGLVAGSAITGLSGYGGADNFFDSAIPHFDFAGFSVSTASGVDYNIYFDGTSDHLCASNTAPTCNPFIGEPTSAIVAEGIVEAPTSAVPESATWAMMLAGFGMIGFAARRRSSVKTTVSFA